MLGRCAGGQVIWARDLPGVCVGQVLGTYRPQLQTGHAVVESVR